MNETVKKVFWRQYADSPRMLCFAIGILALSGFVFVIHASYPGYLNPDSVTQLTLIFKGWRDDWHAPFISLVWSGLLKLAPGPVGFIVFDNLLIWGALALMAAAAARIAGPWGVVVLAVPAMPGVFNYLGHVHKDAMLVAWLLAALACAFHGNGEAVTQRARIAWLTFANLFVVAAFLTRPNAIFALIPLLLYANHCLGRRFGPMLVAVLLVLMPVTQSVQNRLLGVVAQHPADSIKTYHLLALSYFEGRNLFPGEWLEKESRAIVDACYSPVQWDKAAPWGECSFIYESLHRQGLWGALPMTQAWLGALVENPLGAWSAMAATFQLSMHDPNSRSMLYAPPKTDLVNWEVAEPLRPTTRFAQAYMLSELNDRYGRPWVFAAVLAFGITLLLVLRLATTRLGAFALAVLMSGTIYLLTYFPLNVSAEYRYFYWSGFAAWLGLALTMLAWLARRRAAGDGLRQLSVLPGLAVCAATAAMIALVFGSFRLPLERRDITLTSLDAGTITITHLRTASIPPWMWKKIEGQVEAPGWLQEADTWIAQGAQGVPPLTTRIENLHQTVRLRLATGPDGGSVRVDDGSFSRVIDTRAPEVGEIVVDLPPHGRLADRPRHATWHAPVRALLWTIVLTALLFWLGRRGHNSPAKRCQPR